MKSYGVANKHFNDVHMNADDIKHILFFLYDRKFYVSTYKESYLVYCSRKMHVLVYVYIIIGLDNFNQRVEILHKKHQIFLSLPSVRHLDLICARSGYVTAVFNSTSERTPLFCSLKLNDFPNQSPSTSYGIIRYLTNSQGNRCVK